MKCFTIGCQAENGLKVFQEPYPHIKVGERGRGRWEERVPLAQSLRHLENITNASVVKLPPKEGIDKERYLVVEEKETDNRALVLLRTPMGFRGYTKWTGLDKAKVIARTCADGAAGRMGSYQCYLCILEKGTVLTVIRTGRLYGARATTVIFWDGNNIRVGSADEVFPITVEEGVYV